MNTFTFPLPDCPQDHRFYRRKANPFPFSTKLKTPEEVLTLAKQCLFYWFHKLLQFLFGEENFTMLYRPKEYGMFRNVLYRVTGIEGLSLAEEEASSSQNTHTMQEDLNQFQTNFFTSSINSQHHYFHKIPTHEVVCCLKILITIKRNQVHESILFYLAQPMKILAISIFKKVMMTILHHTWSMMTLLTMNQSSNRRDLQLYDYFHVCSRLALAMRILSIRNETEQILGIFVSWKTRALNMDMLVIIVRVLLLVKPWIGCEYLGIRNHNNHICDRTFGSTVRFTPVVSKPELHGKR
ncbi:hypothetical protein PIB30_029991 [Stylosanthes scabra]|uniref:Uncharacterized protein n=1 Tax=Stylosanthes scabra TaxID=79078 RepID=A0ABU6ZB66_9FABA|nr:hypothetical protein [Stylosanthes scabra]